jgi:hypothetical protein
VGTAVRGVPWSMFYRFLIMQTVDMSLWTGGRFVDEMFSYYMMLLKEIAGLKLLLTSENMSTVIVNQVSKPAALPFTDKMDLI